MNWFIDISVSKCYPCSLMKLHKLGPTHYSCFSQYCLPRSYQNGPLSSSSNIQRLLNQKYTLFYPQNSSRGLRITVKLIKAVAPVLGTNFYFSFFFVAMIKYVDNPTCGRKGLFWLTGRGTFHVDHTPHESEDSTKTRCSLAPFSTQSLGHSQEQPHPVCGSSHRN